jgi:hypothetical protein
VPILPTIRTVPSTSAFRKWLGKVGCGWASIRGGRSWPPTGERVCESTGGVHGSAGPRVLMSPARGTPSADTVIVSVTGAGSRSTSRSTATLSIVTRSWWGVKPENGSRQEGSYSDE